MLDSVAKVQNSFEEGRKATAVRSLSSRLCTDDRITELEDEPEAIMIELKGFYVLAEEAEDLRRKGKAYAKMWKDLRMRKSPLHRCARRRLP